MELQPHNSPVYLQRQDKPLTSSQPKLNNLPNLFKDINYRGLFTENRNKMEELMHLLFFQNGNSDLLILHANQLSHKSFFIIVKHHTFIYQY